MFSDGYSNAAIGPVNTVLNAKFPEVMDPKHLGANPRAKSNRNLLSAMAFAGMVSSTAVTAASALCCALPARHHMTCTGIDVKQVIGQLSESQTPYEPARVS